MEYPQELAAKVTEASKNLKLEGLLSGAGPIRPKLMIIGEAPGREEIQSHIPFHGAAGKELMKSLASIGLKREDVYITSAVRSRPYSVKQVYSKREKAVVTKRPNRKPTKKEVLAHACLLDYEIQLVKPKVIITVGTTALERVLGRQYQIKDQHGKAILNTPILQLNKKGDGYERSHKTYTVIPQYHPAAVFYNRKLEPVIAADWLQVKKYI